jgi:ascorbate-specific PTS system EIIC-type component UlaA
MKKDPTTTTKTTTISASSTLSSSSSSSSSESDTETTLSKPLLSPKEKKNCNHKNNHAGDVSKSHKLMEQIQVHRLMSFLCGSMVGILLQMISVFLFTKLIVHAHHHTQELLAENPNLVTPEPISSDATPRETQMFLMNLGQSPWFKVAIWTIYHLSLGVYLIIWFAMMALAVSKVGWKIISSGLRIPEHVTRRTCFLRTFFFINGMFYMILCFCYHPITLACVCRLNNRE